jgi:hypothetical protein
MTKYHDLRKRIEELERKLVGGTIILEMPDGTQRAISEKDLMPILSASMRQSNCQHMGLPIPESKYSDLIDAIRLSTSSNESASHLVDLIKAVSGVGFRAKDGALLTVKAADMPALEKAARARAKGQRTDFDELLDRLTDRDIGVLINYSAVKNGPDFEGHGGPEHMVQ